jgi:hypothetical protein
MAAEKRAQVEWLTQLALQRHQEGLEHQKEEQERVQEGPTAGVGRSPEVERPQAERPTAAPETAQEPRETIPEPELDPSVAVEDVEDAQEAQRSTPELDTEASSEPPAQPIDDPEGRGCVVQWV